MINKHILFLGLALVGAGALGCSENTSKAGNNSNSSTKEVAAKDSLASADSAQATSTAAVDTAKYNEKVRENANGDTTGRWPVKNQPYPLPGAILPFKRIVVYYGNMHSKKMGALGEYAPKEMWRRLNAEVKHWERVDPKTPVQKGIHYIATVASGTAGKDGAYVNRMPEKQIDSALTIAKMENAIVFLDIQVGLSTIQKELPRFDKYLKMSHVHLGIDPEFAMRKKGVPPGRKIGTYDAEEINYVTDYLARIVRENNLPPKVFVLHRFTQGMVTNYKNIKLHPEVQFVVHMDGWGEPELKLGTYRNHIFKEPVQFTGFKLFYKNDLKKAPNRLMTPEELMKLKPVPLYIQYQ
ncbi:hypothetical protein [Desertivirga brevis]|uniref:hypothetical protein n=1 Tax=Desertivirga brevis TaxID=2810310 RepID=UPI001A95D604|nr:hypothetical protein [Pedobacter sp. SYSU D00873]